MVDNIIRIDTVLGLIQQGNDYETSNDFWQAAYCFGDAMGLLFKLAVEMSPENEEEERILDLYQAQCREYLHRGRQALIRAMEGEDSKDVSDKDGDPTFITLADDEAKKRVQLFSTLFSKELEEGVLDIDLPNVSELSEQQCSLEARLKSLNSSLIPSLKTEEERIKDIDRGLKGLGVHVQSYADQPKSTIEVPVSTEDQVANIIAQANDEVRLSIGNSKAELNVEDDTEYSEDDDTSDYEEEEEINLSMDNDIPKLRNKNLIRKSVVKAQLRLSQLLVLLDIKPETTVTPVTTVVLAKESEEEVSDDDDDANSDDDDDERRDAMVERLELDLDQARALLFKAKRNLVKAASSWVVD